MREQASTGVAEPAESERDGRHVLGPWLSGLVFLLIFYVLSPGPVVKIISLRSPPLPPPIFATMYAPLQYLYDSSPVAKHFYDWYIYDIWKVKR